MKICPKTPHHNLICGGTCQLSQPGFVETSYLTAAQLIVCAALDRVHLQFGEMQLIFSPSFDLQWPERKYSLKLLDKRLNDGNALWLYPIRSHHRRVVILNSISNVLRDKLTGRKLISALEPEFLMLLWCSVLRSDVETLSKMLEATRPGVIPQCCLQSLLLKSISLKCPASVTAMLTHGAYASKRLVGGHLCHLSRPIYHLVTKFHKMSLDLTLSDLPKNEQLSNDNFKEQSRLLTEILKNLLNRVEEVEKTDPFALSTDISNVNDDDNCSLRFVIEMALFSDEAPEMIINAGGRYLNGYYELSRNYENSFYSAVDHLGFLVANHPKSMTPELIERMIKFGLIPLFQAGARYNMILKPGEEMDQLVILVENLPYDTLWAGKMVPFLEILAESQIDQARFCRNSLDLLHQLMETCESQNERLLRFLLDFCEASSMKLSRLCRQALVRNLPLGLKARADAINKLPISETLKNYLKFRDVELVAVPEARKRLRRI